MTTNSPLMVKINKQGELVIKIGISTLCYATTCEGSELKGKLQEDTKIIINNELEFANDIVHELKNEEEDGTTLVHRMLDKAAYRAVEYGTSGVDILGKWKPYAINLS